MEPPFIVDFVNEAINFPSSLSLTVVFLQIYLLDLEGSEEGFRLGIVIAVSLSAHGADHAQLVEQGFVGIGAA